MAVLICLCYVEVQRLFRLAIFGPASEVFFLRLQDAGSFTKARLDLLYFIALSPGWRTGIVVNIGERL